jgi:ABC-type hemin transport system ATPase subunit
LKNWFCSVLKSAGSSLFLLCFFSVLTHLTQPGPAKPRYLLLDESTSALDAANEAMLYGQQAAMGITPSASATTTP